MFKVGDFVERLDLGYDPGLFGVKGEVYKVLSVNSYGNIQVIPSERTAGQARYADKHSFKKVDKLKGLSAFIKRVEKEYSK